MAGGQGPGDRAVEALRRLDYFNAIGTVARSAGYGLLARHGGHGVGRAMHEDPHVPNQGRPGRGLVLRPGLVEPASPITIPAVLQASPATKVIVLSGHDLSYAGPDVLDLGAVGYVEKGGSATRTVAAVRRLADY